MPTINDIFTLDFMPSAILVLAWLAFMRRVSTSGWSMAIVGLIGTWLHEVSHYVVGFVLGAKPVSFSLWPKRDGNRWVLGYVGFTGLNIWNSAFVAFAPLLLLAVGVVVIQAWTLPAFAAGSYGSWALSGYVVACALSSCLPSSTDIKVGAVSAFMYGGMGYLVWQLISAVPATA